MRLLDWGRPLLSGAQPGTGSDAWACKKPAPDHGYGSLSEKTRERLRGGHVLVTYACECLGVYCDGEAVHTAATRGARELAERDVVAQARYLSETILRARAAGRSPGWMSSARSVTGETLEDALLQLSARVTSLDAEERASS